MRTHQILGAAAAVLSLSLASPRMALASNLDRPNPPRGFGSEQTVRHWVYYPRYRNFYYTYGQQDPFAYHYEPRGYYPYYNSGEWKPACCIARHRANLTGPKYYSGWGRNKKHRSQSAWHAAQHGEHPFWDW